MSGNHILHVRADPDYPDEPDDYSYTITCPSDPDDMTRQCVTWWECMNHPDGTREAVLDGDGEGPCDEGHRDRPWHQIINGMLCHPWPSCFPAQAECFVDAARDLDLAPGDYPVDYDVEDFSDFTLHVIEADGAGSAS